VEAVRTSLAAATATAAQIKYPCVCSRHCAPDVEAPASYPCFLLPWDSQQWLHTGSQTDPGVPAGQ
jgi:hypothetical protein